MNTTATQVRYRAVSMELAAYLDGRYVEMHILTDTGETVSVVCNNDSIFSIQRHIEEMGRNCPEIATWTTLATRQAGVQGDFEFNDVGVLSNPTRFYRTVSP